jgi:hypothetical protein
MATNIYFLWSSGYSIPAYLTDVTSTYTGKYLKCSSSSFGSTGGTDTHTHTTNTMTIGNNSSGKSVNASDGFATIRLHSHNNGTISGLTSNNDASYYTLGLVRMDLSTWDSYYKVLPPGVVTPTLVSLNRTGYSRMSSLDNKCVKIGTPGSSGGNTNHIHNTSFTTTSCNVSDTIDYGSVAGASEYLSHNHTFSANSSSGVHSLARVSTRLYQVTQILNETPSGVIAFVDGTPSSNWDIVTAWNDYYLESLDQDSATSGSNTHSHTVSNNTSVHTTSSKNFYSGSLNACAYSHFHSVSFNLVSVNHEPQYVTLIPVKLNTTLIAERPHTICVVGS